MGTMNNIQILENGLTSLGLSIDSKMIQSFDDYKQLLLEWNEKINLTAIVEEKEVYVKHFIDSATCIATKLIPENARVIDVGTGAGFPGVPIKILRNDITITLLDSLNKRINYLGEVVNKLKLQKVMLVHSRAEDAGINKEHREVYDIALSRAVAPLNILCEYCLPFVKEGGYFLCQKGPSYLEEVKEAEKAVSLLGGKIEEVFEYQLPETDIKHYVIGIKKLSKTPTKYPRKAGKPTSNPLK